MDNDLEHQVNVIVGTFVVTCLALAFTFGLDSIIACVIGLTGHRRDPSSGLRRGGC